MLTNFLLPVWLPFPVAARLRRIFGRIQLKLKMLQKRELALRFSTNCGGQFFRKKMAKLLAILTPITAIFSES
jgi:hypothetical protein